MSFYISPQVPQHPACCALESSSSSWNGRSQINDRLNHLPSGGLSSEDGYSTKACPKQPQNSVHLLFHRALPAFPKSSSIKSAARESEFPVYQLPPNQQIILLEFYGLTRGCSLLCHTVWRNPWTHQVLLVQTSSDRRLEPRTSCWSVNSYVYTMQRSTTPYHFQHSLTLNKFSSFASSIV